MTSGPGTTGKTDVPPDEAIEEISGLLEMDELKGGESKTPGGSNHPGTDAAHIAAHGAESLDVSMETPGPANLDSYLVPPPVSDESATGKTPEPESASSTNMAYEDLLEKLVLPATPSAPAEPEEAEEPPPFASPRTGSSHSSSSSLGSLYSSNTPGPASSEERTVVTANPLLAEEQEAAAREAESYILPPASAPTPAFAEPPIVAQPVRPNIQPTGLALSKVVHLSYPVFGGMLLGAALVGGLFTRLMTPTRAAGGPPPAQTVAATPVVPAQPARPASPTPRVEQIPTPTESPPAPAAAQPAAPAPAAAAAQPAREPAREVEAPAPAAAAESAAARAKVHHAPRPPKSVAPKPVAAKPATPKPAAPKKPGKGWVDPFL